MKFPISLTLIVCLLASTDQMALAQPVLDADTRVAISVELPVIQTSQRYRNPFVAVWVEDEAGDAVTTVEVWYNRDRWLPDLSQWWRKIGRQGSLQFDSVTGATQRPGNYLVQWDARTVSGEAVPAGKYFILVEVSREHGDTERVRLAIDLGESGSGDQQSGRSEIGLVQALVI